MPPEFAKVLMGQAAGVIIACAIIWALYKLAIHFGGPFIQAQKAQATAMEQQASAMRDQAECLQGMRISVRDYVARDSNDHREILIGLQVVIKEVQVLGEEVRNQGEEIRKQGENITALAQTYEGATAGHVKGAGSLARVVS